MNKNPRRLTQVLSVLKKKTGLIVICLSIMLASYVAMFQHYRSYRFDAKDSGIVYRIESKFLDFRLKMRGPLKTSGKVGILAIDEKSINQFGRWPFSRRYYAQAFDNLKSLGVEWIAFDSFYSEDEPFGADDIRPIMQSMNEDKSPTNIARQITSFQKLEGTSPPDLSFQSGIKNFGQIILGYTFFGSKKEARQSERGDPFPLLTEMASASQIMADLPKDKTLASYPFLKKTYGHIANIRPITSAGQHFAFLNNDSDNDAINRWVTLVASSQDVLMPSLSLKTAAEYLGREIFVVFDEFGVESLVLALRENPEDVLEIPIDPLGAGRMIINPVGPSHAFPHFSLADAYNNSFTDKEKAALKGTVLLMGGTAAGTSDIRPNAFDPTLDGVENHAAAVENIIMQNFLKRPVSIYKTELLIIFGLGLLFAPLMIFSNALVSGISVLVFLIAYYYVDKFFWFGQGTWVFIAVPCLEIISMFLLTTLYKYMTEEGERKKVRGAFQHYLSPDVINQMLENPEALQLGGVRRDLTVLFSDVRGFTTISEVLSPEKLSELMNNYFTPMTSIVLRSGGVLDKYIGDAIMAFWGAPLPSTNHADTAAQGALDMLVALDTVRAEFKKKNFPAIDIGIGLNSGPMSVGNMGSDERFTYTVMGDAVNLGARLEGLTKEYGIKIMISEFTERQLTPGRFFTRDLDNIRVKGKLDSVHVFELVRADAMGTQEKLETFLARFKEGRLAYQNKDWPLAMEIFGQCLSLKPDDKPSTLYRERCVDLSANPPGDDWDGVYTFTHK